MAALVERSYLGQAYRSPPMMRWRMDSPVDSNKGDTLRSHVLMCGGRRYKLIYRKFGKDCVSLIFAFLAFSLGCKI